MQKLAFFKGLAIGLSLSSFLWLGILTGVKKIALRKAQVKTVQLPPQDSFVALWPED